MVYWLTGWSHKLGPSFRLSHIFEYLTLYEFRQTAPAPKCRRSNLRSEPALGDEHSIEILPVCVFAYVVSCVYV